MVFIVSEEYLNPYGKPTVNVINIGSVDDLKIIRDADEYTICVNQGDFEKFICKSESIEEARDVIQGIYNSHVKHEGHVLVDVETVKPKQVDHMVSLEDIHDIMLELLEELGYPELVQLYESKLAEKDEPPVQRNRSLDEFLGEDFNGRQISANEPIIAQPVNVSYM